MATWSPAEFLNRIVRQRGLTAHLHEGCAAFVGDGLHPADVALVAARSVLCSVDQRSLWLEVSALSYDL